MEFLLNTTLIEQFPNVFLRLNSLIVNYNLEVIFMLIFLFSTEIFAIQKKSLYAIIISFLAVGIYLYQWKIYQYPLFNDPYEEFIYAIKHTQLTSLRHSVTYISLILLPVLLGFLSIELKKK